MRSLASPSFWQLQVAPPSSLTPEPGDALCEWCDEGAGATPEAIDKGFQKVKAAAWGRLARFYRGLSTVDLPPDAIDRILDADTVWFWNELCRLLPEVRSYPDHIQEALLDLGYNLGSAGLMARKSLIAATRKGDWEAAAALSNRRQVGDERNKQIAGLFLSQEARA